MADERTPDQPAHAQRIRATARVQVSSDRGVFMISVAAELAGMHPQTLRMYESRGLIEPNARPRARGCTPTPTSSDSSGSRR